MPSAKNAASPAIVALVAVAHEISGRRRLRGRALLRREAQKEPEGVSGVEAIPRSCALFGF